MNAKLNLGTTLAALVLFLLPWLDIRCSGNTVATQTGLQTIYGGASLSDQMKAFEQENDGRTEKGPGGIAIFVALALIAAMAAFAVALGDFRSGKDVSQSRAGALCLIAIVLILLQMVIKFPVERGLAEEMKKSGNSDQPLAGVAASAFKVQYAPGFYLELIALGIPAAFAVNRYVDKMKKT